MAWQGVNQGMKAQYVCTSYVGFGWTLHWPGTNQLTQLCWTDYYFDVSIAGTNGTRLFPDPFPASRFRWSSRHADPEMYPDGSGGFDPLRYWGPAIADPFFGAPIDLVAGRYTYWKVTFQVSVRPRVYMTHSFKSISCLASDRFAIDVQLMSIYLSILSDSQRVQESLLMSNLDLFGFACSEGPRIPRSLLLIVSDIIIAMIMTMTRMILCVLLGSAGGPSAWIIAAFVAGSRFYYDCFWLVYIASGFLLLTFIFFGSLTVMNMLLGVLVEARFDVLSTCWDPGFWRASEDFWLLLR